MGSMKRSDKITLTRGEIEDMCNDSIRANDWTAKAVHHVDKGETAEAKEATRVAAFYAKRVNDVLLSMSTRSVQGVGRAA